MTKIKFLYRNGQLWALKENQVVSFYGRKMSLPDTDNPIRIDASEMCMARDTDRRGSIHALLYDCASPHKLF